MLRKIIPFAIGVVCSLPLVVQAGVTVTDEQKSNFSSVAHISENSFKVPTIIDVPVAFSPFMVEQYMVVGSSGIGVPSTVVSQTSQETLRLRVVDSDGVQNPSAMVDRSTATFAEFPYLEAYDEKHNRKENWTTIDILSDRPFRADAFTVSLDAHIARPNHVRVMAVLSNGEEQILLPEQTMGSNHITFPTGNTDHFRISFGYTNPLRVNEIVFYEKDIPYTTQKYVRFIAQPGESYDIYFDSIKAVSMNMGEMPNLSGESKKTVSPESVRKNELFRKADADADSIADDQDNCINVPNSAQTDDDGNGIGDECEDFDKDGVMNSSDNCVNDPNRNQSDVDNDGIGDTCDGQESRLTERLPWLPWAGMGFATIVIAGLFILAIKGMSKKDGSSNTDADLARIPENKEGEGNGR